MTSSMMAGERRWASSRRGGMTVLGKVAVPKPINLPSQKLENHGLDPNVEIVPKGSLSWGSRPSSSTSNPWGSAGSPNADGSTASPHHPSGRPSSGGGLSRPSTAGSDRHEPSASTWGPNSRPSSASGVLTSNQSSLTSRPLSAETRPGSSSLSRFAEPVYDNSMAWGPNGNADRLSIPSKANDFSLSSGDFPTLGSEKDNNAKGSEHDHGSHARPGSGSGRSDRNEMAQADHKSGTVDTWTRDSSPPGDKWQGEPQHYLNPNVPPQHFDAWRGPPMNAPPVWYRGPPPAGPPYPPVPHGGFPMEPFPYYRPQMPPNLANPQAGPQNGPGPRGHHPRNGDFYRPQMPEPFIRPGMPMRPGFYPGPVPYDGYYGPPMGYNPNDREMPYMGMPPGPHGPHGPPVYNMYPPQNHPEHNDAHFRPGGHGPSGNMFVSEQMEPVQPEEPRGPYKVLRKRDSERDAGMEEDNWEQNLEKNDQPRPSFHKNERGTDTRRNEDMHSRRNNFVENPSSRMVHNQGYPSDSANVLSSEDTHKFKASNENWGKKSEVVAPSIPEVPHAIPSNPRDSSLIQKIEGLNAKVRASDARGDAASGFTRDEQKNRLLVNPKDNSTITFGSISDTGDLANASSFSRQAHHGGRSRPDQYTKGRLNSQDAHASTFQVPPEAAENLETRNTGDSLADVADGQAQRARMRELAKQRALQLQKEEEERIREQKAKALAKLEELNRRTLTSDGTTQTTEKIATSVPDQDDVNTFQKSSGPPVDDNSSKQPTGPSSGLNANTLAVVLSNENISKSSQQEPVVKQSVAIVTDVETKTDQKQKRVGHKQKESVQDVESSVDKSTMKAPASADAKNSGNNLTISSEAVPKQEPVLPSIMSEPTQPRKKNNRSSKNKHKLDDASESGKPESPKSDVVTDSKDAPQSKVEQISSLPSNEFHGRVTNQYKPQHSRKTLRNPQANRSADRFHGDAAVWAPVRAQPKEERLDENSQGTMQDDMPLPAKSINSAQTNLKSKRAEMERYVPKPVAKELAQQGTSLQSSPEKSTIEDMTDREDLGPQPAIPVSSSAESKIVDNKQMKQVKSQGPWKQRGPTEMHQDQGFQQSAPLTSNPTKRHNKSNTQHEVTNPVVTETNVTHEWDPSDGWFMPEDPPAVVAPVTSVVKDEGGFTGKGKRPAYKGQRSTVRSHDIDHKDISGAEFDQADRPASSKENRSSHWQPKPQTYRGGWSGGGTNANSEVKKDQTDEPVAEYKNVRGPHDGYQENRRERKPASYRGRPHSPNHMEDEAQFDQQQQHVSSGYRKYGGPNIRPGGQDDRRKHNQHNNANINRERPRQNQHYEYQPVGSNNNNSNKSSNIDAPADASGNAGPRYKERGSGQQSRRGGGNFYGRQ